MLVSRNALQSYPQLAGTSNSNYFNTRTERNTYFGGNNIPTGQYCAVGGNPDNPDWSEVTWQVEQYNGTNWAEVALDANFALVVTNDGLLALTNASSGQYKVEISRVAIKQTPISAGENLSTWTKNKFLSTSNGYIDICLDTHNTLNTTFTLANNLTHRTNLLNGGIQFTLELGISCLGQLLTSETTGAPTLTEYNVSAIGLFVKNQNSTEGEDVLFAVANLPAAVTKLATTPSTVGNSLKFYLNTTLSNMGNVTDVSILHSSVGSVPEVATEDDLIDSYDGVNAPYNLYVIDDLQGTNIPAIAIRKGNPTSPTNPINWTYFTPSDDSLLVDSSLLDSNLQNYMIANWDAVEQKYVRSDSNSTTQQLAGLYNASYILYAGKVTNKNTAYKYTYSFNNNEAIGYKVGETVNCVATGASTSIPSVTFTIQIMAVDELGKPYQYYVTPTTGNNNVSTNNTFVNVTYPIGQLGDGTGLKMKISSSGLVNIFWNFPNSWVNKPLFADYDHTSESTEVWEAYLVATGLPATEQRDRRGKLTCVETGMFIGWCINNNTIKLALDLRSEATETIYGTTRYATNAEVSNVAGNMEASVATSVTPLLLRNNFLQTTVVAGSSNPGVTPENPIEVNSHIHFNQTIYGKGSTYAATDPNNISFFGTAYRATWADLAEYYRSDKVYPAGSLITIGSGLAEITEAKTECNGIISTKPGYELGEKESELDLPVGLVGKLPVLFAEDCVPHFGDRIYLSKTTPGRASTVINGKCLGKIIDKREHLDQKTTIMCSIRIAF